MIPNIFINDISMHELGWIRESIDMPVPQVQKTTIVIPSGSKPIRHIEGYEPRSVEIVLTMNGSLKDFYWKVSEVINLFSSVIVEVATSEEPTFYIEGTLDFETSYEPIERKGTLILRSEDADAYRYHKELTLVDVEGDEDVILQNDFMPTIPTICTSCKTKLIWNVGDEKFQKTLSEGEWKIPELELKQGKNTIRVESKGITSIIYQEGRL